MHSDKLKNQFWLKKKVSMFPNFQILFQKRKKN